jgi:hypothetical protein
MYVKSSFGIAGFALAAALTGSGCVPARGPVYVASAEVEVEAEPPPPQVEVQPAVPYANAVWIEGHWAWRGRWVWIRGHWEVGRAGWAWLPHHWARRGNHWVFMPGHWQRV